MNFILSLPIFQTKKNELLDNNNKLLFNELPFYGIGGTIYCIEEAEEAYYKVIYNQDGTINPQKLPIPKKKGRNFILVQEDYYNEVKTILDKLREQYLEYEHNNYKSILSNSQFYILAIVTFLASMASIPFLLSTAWIGLVFATVSVLSLYIVCDIHKRDIQNTKEKDTFMKQYKKLEKDLSDYQSGITISMEQSKKVNFTKVESVDKSFLNELSNNNRRLIKQEFTEAA